MADSELRKFKIQSISPPLMKGILFKRGSFRPNWTKRLITLDRGRLVYYEPSHWLQVGDRDLTSFSIEETHSLGELVIFLTSSKGLKPFVVKTKSSSHLTLWKSSFIAHIAFARLISENPIKLLRIAQRVMEGERPTLALANENENLPPAGGSVTQSMVSNPSSVSEQYSESRSTVLTQTTLGSEPPPTMKGWILKRGHIVRNWKRRYCILEKGELRYYLIEKLVPVERSKRYQEILKGTLYLEGYSTVIENVTGSAVDRENSSGPGNIMLKPGSSLFGKNLLIALDNDVDWLMWAAALQLHINFANENEPKTRRKSYSSIFMPWRTSAALDSDASISTSNQSIGNQRRYTIAVTSPHIDERASPSSSDRYDDRNASALDCIEAVAGSDNPVTHDLENAVTVAGRQRAKSMITTTTNSSTPAGDVQVGSLEHSETGPSETATDDGDDDDDKNLLTEDEAIDMSLLGDNDLNLGDVWNAARSAIYDLQDTST